MRLIIPIILIALMLPYALGEDKPNGEWLIPPNPPMGTATSNAAAGVSDGRQPSDAPTTQPATQPTGTALAAAARSHHR